MNILGCVGTVEMLQEPGCIIMLHYCGSDSR